MLRNAGSLMCSEEMEEQPAEVGFEASIFSGHLPVQFPASRFPSPDPPWALDALGNFVEHANIHLDNLLSSAQ